MANSELPRRENKRGGPGWWMDLDGAWRSPSEWPEDTAPLDGWQRSPNGTWHAPSTNADDMQAETTRSPVAVADRVAETEPRRSRQATADRKAMLTVAGALGAAALLLAVALILITQAGAEDPVTAEDSVGTVIFAAETNEVRMERRRGVAASAPSDARSALSELATRTEIEVLPTFDQLAWDAQRTDCLDITEQVLVDRSQRPIIWADQLQCVPDTGQWEDRYLTETLTRTIDAEVISHVPERIVYASGGHQWTEATRQAFLTDSRHPATLQVVSAGAGHNPRAQGPSEWKPSSEAQWCAYAVDWVAVKHRWELDVTAVERTALESMLDTCPLPSSEGADPMTMVIDPLGPPTIERIITNS